MRTQAAHWIDWDGGSAITIIFTIKLIRWNGWTTRTSSSARTSSRSTTTSRSSSVTPKVDFRFFKFLMMMMTVNVMRTTRTTEQFDDNDQMIFTITIQSEIAESCATVKEYCRSNTEDVNNNIVEFKEVTIMMMMIVVQIQKMSTMILSSLKRWQ